SDRFELVRAGGAFLYRPRAASAGSAHAASSPKKIRTPAPTTTTARATTGRATAARATPARRSRPQLPKHAAPGADATDTPSVMDLLASGSMAMATQDVDAAVATFRRAVFVDPDHPLANFHLALALQRSGDRAAAARSFAAARASVARCDP